MELEMVVVDGGSQDGTCAAAQRLGARVISAPPSRGTQLGTGADAASHDWLLFLHADTVLGPGWSEAAHAFMNDDANRTRAAVFRFALDDPDPRARRLERWTRWRGRALGLAFGDQGLLVSRAFYRELGGFRPIPLMEDVALVRRIGRRRLVFLENDALPSAARYRRGGWWLIPARNLALLTMSFLGVPPSVLIRLYR
jgi:rSAM/selenodomain-associated transferase 2